MWNSVLIPGETGSENGIIIADEEYKNVCRITLEKCERYYAITCGVMVQWYTLPLRIVNTTKICTIT